MWILFRILMTMAPLSKCSLVLLLMCVAVYQHPGVSAKPYREFKPRGSAERASGAPKSVVLFLANLPDSGTELRTDPRPVYEDFPVRKTLQDCNESQSKFRTQPSNKGGNHSSAEVFYKNLESLLSWTSKTNKMITGMVATCKCDSEDRHRSLYNKYKDASVQYSHPHLTGSDRMRDEVKLQELIMDSVLKYIELGMEPSMVESEGLKPLPALVDMTLSKLQKTSGPKGYLLVVKAAGKEEVADVDRSVNLLMEQTDPETTLLVVASLYPPTRPKLGEPPEFRVFAKGPNASILKKCKTICQLPLLLEAAMEDGSGNDEDRSRIPFPEEGDPMGKSTGEKLFPVNHLGEALDFTFDMDNKKSSDKTKDSDHLKLIHLNRDGGHNIFTLSRQLDDQWPGSKPVNSSTIDLPKHYHHAMSTQHPKEIQPTKTEKSRKEVIKAFKDLLQDLHKHEKNIDHILHEEEGKTKASKPKDDWSIVSKPKQVHYPLEFLYPEEEEGLHTTRSFITAREEKNGGSYMTLPSVDDNSSNSEMDVIFDLESDIPMPTETRRHQRRHVMEEEQTTPVDKVRRILRVDDDISQGRDGTAAYTNSASLSHTMNCFHLALIMGLFKIILGQ